MGETGSGKSTFAKLLTRLMDPSAGAVLLDGIDVREVSQEDLRRSVVLVPQEGFLFNDTITANVRYGRLGRLRGGHPRLGRGARPGRLAREPPARAGDPGGPAR